MRRKLGSLAYWALSITLMVVFGLAGVLLIFGGFLASFWSPPRF